MLLHFPSMWSKHANTTDLSLICMCLLDPEGGNNTPLQAETRPLQAQPSSPRLFPEQSLPQRQASPTGVQDTPTHTESVYSSLQAPITMQKGDEPSTPDLTVVHHSLTEHFPVYSFRVEARKKGCLIVIPRTLLIHTPSVGSNKQPRGQFSFLLLVLRAHLSRASSPSTLTGLSWLTPSLLMSWIWYGLYFLLLPVKEISFNPTSNCFFLVSDLCILLIRPQPFHQQ